MKISELRILVASESDADAQQIGAMLAHEFDNVATSAKEERFADDFDTAMPDVVVLAFHELEAAERCHLGLYRHSKIAHAQPHRSIVLCSKDNVRRAFELCRKGYFDDYVLFWPMVFDSTRLAMSIIIAGRSLLTGQSDAVSRRVFASADVAGTLETALDEQLEAGRSHLSRLDSQFSAVERELSAFDTHFELDLDPPESDTASDVLPAPTEAQGGTLARATDGVRYAVEQSRKEVVPLTTWINNVKRDLTPQLEAVRTIRSLAAERLAVVLVVDDDEFQRKLLTRLLETLRCQVHVAQNGADTFATLGRHRPDLILMDIELPDTDGITLTRRIKAIPALAQTPIVMITGHSEPQTIAASIKAGASDFVVKPFDRTVLMKKLARFVFIGEDV
ncbi:response regulator [Azoarcus taiwanensis]|uniref:Response regulator n=1 Tax=Azoarcus taiwanensis TaxID=666964 RepID=A0A972FA96_9RHOO|nr:response regulator [Azoarcus taiwanensis]NMG01503.1 response regulator [Azoarcus taiwanensis]